MDRVERLTNRLVAAALTSSFIVGLAVLILLFQPFGSQRWIDVAFLLALAAAIALGARLTWSLFRERV